MFIMQLNLQRNYIATSADVEKEAARVVRDNRQALLDGKQIEFPFWLNNKYYSQGNELIAQKFTSAVIKQMLSDAFIKAAKDQGIEITPEQLKAQIKYTIHNPFTASSDKAKFIDNYISQTSGDNISFATLLAEMPKFIDKTAFSEKFNVPPNRVGFEVQSFIVNNLNVIQSKEALYAWMSENFDILNFPSSSWRGTYVEKSFDKMREYYIGDPIKVNFRAPLSKQIRGANGETIVKQTPTKLVPEEVIEKESGPIAGLSSYSNFSILFNQALTDALREFNSTWDGAQILCASDELLIKYHVNSRNLVISESFDSIRRPIIYDPDIFDKFENPGAPLLFMVPEWMGAGAAELLASKLKKFFNSQGITCDIEDQGRNEGPDGQYYYGFKATPSVVGEKTTAPADEVFPGEVQNPKISKINTNQEEKPVQPDTTPIRITVPKTVTVTQSKQPVEDIPLQKGGETIVPDGASGQSTLNMSTFSSGLSAEFSRLREDLGSKYGIRKDSNLLFSRVSPTADKPIFSTSDGSPLFFSEKGSINDLIYEGKPIDIYVQSLAGANPKEFLEDFAASTVQYIQKYGLVCVDQQPEASEVSLTDNNGLKVKFYRVGIELSP